MKFLKYIAETNLVAVVKFIFELIICLIVMSIVSIVTVITAIFVFPFIRKHTDNDDQIWWAWRPVFLEGDKFPFFALFKNVRRKKDWETGIGFKYYLINNDD